MARTRKIGDIFYVEKEMVFLQVVPDNGSMGSCRGCYFDGLGFSCTQYRDTIGHCGALSRGDRIVVFKEVQPQIEPEPCPRCHKDNCNGCIIFN